MFVARQPDVIVTMLDNTALKGVLVSPLKVDRLVLAEVTAIGQDGEEIAVDGQVIVPAGGWSMMQVVG
ncbi:hypothetical protein [Stomatohabitans albus]|uniref:hypothetical protein n=1 Tax=Stomatohabitans albus TaxID=3110766 RepID=UPI00300D38C2